MTDRPLMTRENILSLTAIGLEEEEKKETDFEVIEDQIILTPDQINRESHVQVRVLSATDLLFDFTSGRLLTQEQLQA
jgi:hypothetical protein